MSDFIKDDDFEVNLNVDIPEGGFNKDTNEPVDGVKPAEQGGNNFNTKWKGKKKGIDLFNDKVEPITINFKDSGEGKSFYIAAASITTTIDDDKKEEIKNILRKLAIKGYTARGICSNMTQFMEDISDVFDFENILITKPWKKFCVVNGFKTNLPTDANKQAAANYFKKFNDLPTAIKHINSAFITALFGEDNKDHVDFLIVYDPYVKEDNKVDFKKSPNTSNVFLSGWLFRDKGFNIYNLYKEEDRKNLLTLLG